MSRTFEVLNGTEWLCMPEEVYAEIGGTDRFYKSVVDMIFRSIKHTALFGEREQDGFEGWNARCAAKGETEKIIEDDDACDKFFAATLVILDQISIRHSFKPAKLTAGEFNEP